MFAKIQKRWRQIRRPPEATIIILSLVILLVLIVLIIIGYLLRWDWTGLNQKTLWDWLQLLIIPAVLTVGGYLFNFTTTRTEQESTRQRDQTERDLTLDNQREAALQTYIDKISELLLLEKNLRESQPDDEVRTIARVRTLTTLPRLDNKRKASVLQFLYESKLIEKGNSIVNLSRADLSKADLRVATLSEADLSETDLDDADLKYASLNDANLSRTLLNRANLSGAWLNRAYLSGAYLNRANLSGAYLSGANLGAADLRVANLSGAWLNRANLNWAILSGADLSEADLSEADLSGASIYQQKLDTAKSLENTIMPDGSKHP